MTNFHQSLTNLVQEVDRFLTDTLKSEKLSKSSQKHRDELTQIIAKLREEWPQLNNSPNLNNNRLKSTDGTDGSSGSGGPMEEDENAYSENIPMVNAKSLTEYDKCGFLLKKRKKGGLVTKLQNQFQKRYCVLSKGILYYFEKPTDKKQLGAFPVAGYDFQQCPTLTTEEKKKDLCFELVSDGKRTYQFMAETTDEFFSWRLAIKGNSADLEDDIYEDIPGNEPPQAEAEGSAGSAKSLGRPPPTPAPAPLPPEPVAEGDEFYDDVANTQSTDKQRKPPEIHTEVASPDEVYDDAVTAPAPPPPPSSPRPKPPGSPLPKVPDRKLPSSPPPPVPPPHSDVPLPPPPLPPHSDLPPPPLPDDLPPPPPPPPSRPPAKPATVPPPVPDRNEVKPQLAMPFLPRVEDFENLFFGRWDCQASSNQELAFIKGDVIHVLSRDLDEKSWWVGELKGKVGLVPKTYLVNAFELVP